MQLFSQLATRTITNDMVDVLSERKMSSDWPILKKLRCKLLRGCHTQATCLSTLRKVEGRSKKKKCNVNVICLPTEHQGAQRTRLNVAVHSQIELEFGNVGF